MRTGIVLLSLFLIAGCTQKDQADDQASGEPPAEAADPIHLMMVEGTALPGNPMFKEGTVQVIAVAVHGGDGGSARQLAMEKVAPMGYGNLDLRSHEQIEVDSLPAGDPRAELCREAMRTGYSMAVFDLQEEDQKPAEAADQ
jgi:hypothetical protein